MIDIEEFRKILEDRLRPFVGLTANAETAEAMRKTVQDFLDGLGQQDGIYGLYATISHSKDEHGHDVVLIDVKASEWMVDPNVRHDDRP